MKQSIKQFLTIFLAAMLLLSCLPQVLAADNLMPQGQYIVKFREEAVLAGDDTAPFTLLNGDELGKALRLGLVDWYEEDYEAVLLEDEWAKWDLDMIDAQLSAAQGYMGQGIRIGVVDSGVAPHPDLVQNLLPGYNYVDSNRNTADTYGHGTFVCGILAAQENHQGIVGVAPLAKLVPLKCFNGSSANVSLLCSAIYDAVNTYHCQIINLSFAMKNAVNSEALQQAIQYATQKGAIVVAAAGNFGGTELYYPAAYDNVIGVGAIDRNGAVWSGSQRNESVFLTAPGVNVKSTGISDGGYRLGSGTSYAAAQVSGAIAVLLSIDPTLTYQQICNLLRAGAVDQGQPGYDTDYGYGILNLGNSAMILLNSKHTAASYRIQAVSSHGGTVTLSESSSVAGKEIVITATPQTGYILEQLHVTDDLGKSLQTFKSSNGTYRFEMPASHVTVTATFAMEPQINFLDVPKNAYYAPAVIWAAAHQITKGVSETSFAPAESCSRGQVVTFLWRAAGSPSPAQVNPGFVDVPRDSYYAQAVAWASQFGITTGTSSNRFSPNEICTREQIVTFLWRYAKSRGDNVEADFDLSRFQDVSRLSAFALRPAQWACSKSILQGDGKSLMPKDICSRAQIVTFLYRYLG